MDGYGSYGASYPPAQTAYPRYSFAPSTHNWVHSQQQHPAVAPPPQAVEYPTPVRALRPLPNPHEQRPRSLLVVNNPDPEPQSHFHHEEGAGFSDLGSSGPARGPKSKKALDRWVKGIRRLPQKFFRKGGSKKTTAATAGISSPSATDFTGNTLPGYTSKPTSPLATHVRPAMQQMQHFQAQYQSQSHATSKPQLAPQPSYPAHGTPMPDVVRLSTTSSMNARRHNPSFRVTPPSDDFLHGDHHIAAMQTHNGGGGGGGGGGGEDAGSVYGTPRAERVTVMAYSSSVDNTRSQSFTHHPPWANHPTPHPTPPPVGVSRQLTASPGLSYVSEEDPAPPPVLVPGRSASHHSSLHAPPPPPIEIPQGYPDSVRRVSYASQIPPRRETPPAHFPGAFPTSEASTAPVFHSAAPSLHMEPTHATMPSQPSYAPPDAHAGASSSNGPAPTATPSPAGVLSPVSIHPVPTADYRKMTLSPSPSSALSLTSGGHTRSGSEHATSTSGYYDPSFASQLNMNRFERFFKTLYHMPWVSHARVTADYAPGEGIGKKPARRIKPMTSWYRAWGHGRASVGDKRGSGVSSGHSLDLLSNGTASPRMSLGAGAALLMEDGVTAAAVAGNALQVGTQEKDARHRESGATERRKQERDYERRSRAQGRRKAATWLDGKYEKSRRPRSRRRSEYDHGHEYGHPGHSESQHHTKENAPSPLIPPIYPYAFPSYPYTGYQATYQMPQPDAGALGSADGAQMSGVERPRGPRPLVPVQPQIMYAVPAHGMYGMNAYSGPQMVAPSPQPVYFLPPAAMTSPALQRAASGSGNGDINGDDAAPQGNAGLSPPQAQPLRHQISSPTLMYLQPIPGAF